MASTVYAMYLQSLIQQQAAARDAQAQQAQQDAAAFDQMQKVQQFAFERQKEDFNRKFKIAELYGKTAAMTGEAPPKLQNEAFDEVAGLGQREQAGKQDWDAYIMGLKQAPAWARQDLAERKFAGAEARANEYQGVKMGQGVARQSMYETAADVNRATAEHQKYLKGEGAVEKMKAEIARINRSNRDAGGSGNDRAVEQNLRMLERSIKEKRDGLERKAAQATAEATRISATMGASTKIKRMAELARREAQDEFDAYEDEVFTPFMDTIAQNVSATPAQLSQALERVFSGEQAPQAAPAVGGTAPVRPIQPLRR